MLLLVQYLFSNCLNDSRKIVVLPLARFHPRCKVPQFSIIPIIRQPHLGPNEKNLAIMNNDAAIVDDILVDDRPGVA